MYIDWLNSLHSKAMQIIDCHKHRNATNIELERLYCLLTPKTRRREHHCAIMYRQSRISKILDVYRPSINLRSRNKVKFRQKKGNLKGIDKSPLSRGITLMLRWIDKNNSLNYSCMKLVPEMRQGGD